MCFCLHCIPCKHGNNQPMQPSLSSPQPFISYSMSLQNLWNSFPTGNLIFEHGVLRKRLSIAEKNWTLRWYLRKYCKIHVGYGAIWHGNMIHVYGPACPAFRHGRSRGATSKTIPIYAKRNNMKQLHPQSLTWNIMQRLNWNYMGLSKDVSTGLLVPWWSIMEDCF